MNRKDAQLVSKKLVTPENLEILFLYQELLGRGLKAWRKKRKR